MSKSDNAGSKERAASIQWADVIKAMCMCGSFTVKIEGFRFHFKEAYYELLKPFEAGAWLTWPVGKCYAKIARASDERFFWDDRKRFESRLGSERAGLSCGDLPISIRFMSKGRLNLPEQITQMIGKAFTLQQ